MLHSKNISLYFIIFFSGTILFHLLVLLGVIPFEIVWGGRLKSHSEMLAFETVSILINTFMLLVMLAKRKHLNWNAAFVKISIWLMGLIFVLNTVGNLFSESKLEAWLFTPITFVSAVFCFMLVLRKEE